MISTWVSSSISAKASAQSRRRNPQLSRSGFGNQVFYEFCQICGVDLIQLLFSLTSFRAAVFSSRCCDGIASAQNDWTAVPKGILPPRRRARPRKLISTVIGMRYLWLLRCSHDRRNVIDPNDFGTLQIDNLFIDQPFAHINHQSSKAATEISRGLVVNFSDLYGPVD